MTFCWLVFGARGFVGRQLIELLEASGQEVVQGGRISSYEDAVGAVDAAVATNSRTIRIVCALGRTHTSTCASIDGLEGAEAWPDLVLANHSAPVWIARAAAQRALKVLYLGTGCIYTGGGVPYTEQDPPNFFGSAYSRVKAATDIALGTFDNVLVARIRMPVADVDSPRDLLHKLWGYPIICDDGPNSVSVLADVLPALLALAHHGVTGVFNAVTPDGLSHPEILNIFALHGMSHEHTVVTNPDVLALRAGRSRCVLSAAKLQRALSALPSRVRDLYGALPSLPPAPLALARVARLRCCQGGQAPREALPVGVPDPARAPACLLVTGGCGFIGSHFIDAWLQAHPCDRVVNIDCLDEASGSSTENVLTTARTYEHLWLDLTMHGATATLTKIMEDRQVTHVVHFAAKTHVDDSFDGQLALSYTATNALGTHGLLEAARRYGRLQRFVHISTDEIYGTTCVDQKADETALLQPTNPYAASKAAAEMMVHAYGFSLQVPCVTVRMNNIYVPRQHTTKVIPRFCSLAARGGVLPIHGDGTATRGFLHVADAVRAIALLLERGDVGSVYNIAGGCELTVAELAERVNELASSPGGVQHVENRPYNDLRYYIDDAQLRGLGWEPRIAFGAGLAETFRYFASSPSAT